MIERSYPAVYIVELPAAVKEIDGVHTASPDAAPDWTDRNQSDPGVTLLQLLAFLGDHLLYRANLSPQRPLHPQAVGFGVVQGLAVQAAGSESAPEVRVSQGEALRSDGKPIDPKP